MLITLLAVFGTFNAGADTYALLRAIPAGFAQAGLVTAIALAYMPQTLTRWAEIREAQTLRGHRLRGARDLVPLAVPLLTGGLDRAINLAEAMEARGFAPEGSATARPVRASAAGADSPVAGRRGGRGAARRLPQRLLPPAAGRGLGSAGGGRGNGLAALVALGRRSARTRYRRELWRGRDQAVSPVLLAGAGLILSC